MSRGFWFYAKCVADVVGMLLMAHGVAFALNAWAGIDADPIAAFAGIIGVRVAKLSREDQP